MEKTCKTCTKDFVPSSNHLDCPSCRYHKQKIIPCKFCGTSLHSKQYGSCKSCSNKLKPNYGTGRYLKNGYVMVFQKGHPRAQGSRGNYVFEHILQMENHLGRYLASGENVHHINGVKEDNSVDNLELWTKPQPTGIRASDALEWAKETIELYEPLQGKI